MIMDANVCYQAVWRLLPFAKERYPNLWMHFSTLEEIEPVRHALFKDLLRRLNLHFCAFPRL